MLTRHRITPYSAALPPSDRVSSVSFLIKPRTLALPPDVAAASVWVPPRPEWGKILKDFTKALFDATNAFRMAHGGDQPYGWDDRLAESIRWKLLHECGGQYMGHDDPFEDIGDQPPCPRGWYDRIVASGYDGGHPGFQGAAAENLLYGATNDPTLHGFDTSDPVGSAQRMVEMWTAAGPGEGHYDNIMRSARDWGAPPVMACDVALASNGLAFAGQDFGTGLGQPVPPPDPGPTPPPPPDPVPTPPPTHDRPAKGDTWVSKANAKATVHVDAVFDKKGVRRVTYTNRKGTQVTTTETRFLQLFKFVRAA